MPRKFTIHLSIGYPTAEHEDEIVFSDEELEGMSEADIEAKLEEAMADMRSNYVENWWKEVKPDDVG